MQKGQVQERRLRLDTPGGKHKRHEAGKGLRHHCGHQRLRGFKWVFLFFIPVIAPCRSHGEERPGLVQPVLEREVQRPGELTVPRCPACGRKSHRDPPREAGSEPRGCVSYPETSPST